MSQTIYRLLKNAEERVGQSQSLSYHNLRTSTKYNTAIELPLQIHEYYTKLHPSTSSSAIPLQPFKLMHSTEHDSDCCSSCPLRCHRDPTVVTQLNGDRFSRSRQILLSPRC